MKLTLLQKKQETADVVSFIFQSETPVIWKAGQYMHYTLPHENQDARLNDRYFTISSAPSEKNIMLTTRFTSQKSSSFKRALKELPIGGIIEADGPEGDFTLEEPGEYIFIAGGIGVTPFRSILKDLEHKKISIEGKLLYGNRDSHLIFKDELEDMAGLQKNFRMHYFIDPERIVDQAIKKLVPDISKPFFYVSGPEPMVEAFEKMLSEMGVSGDHTKRDYFPGYEYPEK